MSKMNKSELYKLCKEQQETIKTLQFHNGCLEEANNTFTLGANRTLQSNCKLQKENKKLQEELNKKDMIISVAMSSHDREANDYNTLLDENDKLKEKLEFTQKVKEDYFNTIKWKNDNKQLRSRNIKN